MTKTLSLKYRIALIIFLLEAIMMTVVLWQTLGHSQAENARQLAANEDAMLGVIAAVSRRALLTEEYGDLLPYFAEVKKDPHVIRLILSDISGRVVSSTVPGDIGQSAGLLDSGRDHYWRTQKISNAAGGLGELAIEFSRQQQMQIYTAARSLGLTIAIGGMLLIAVVGVMVGHFLTLRLNRLSRSATRLAEGELSVRSGIRGADEIGVLGENFDQMAAAMQRYTRELEVEVEKRTAEIQLARNMAEQASQAKSEFLSSMSHELRTPLNSIIGFASILNMGMAGELNEEQARQLSMIESSARNLLDLINDVLDLSKIEAGKVDVVYKQFVLSDLLAEVVDQLGVLFENRPVHFSADIDACKREIRTDREKLFQILLNLVSNANKFTDTGKVELRCECHDGGIEISVIDTGIGIEPEQQVYIFQSFRQAVGGDSRTHSGTGLGLAISQKFADLLGGTIRCESVVGKGSIFTLSLPDCLVSPSGPHQIEHESP